MRGHEARLKAAAEKLRRSPQESPKSRRPENRIASLQGATIKSRGETSDGGDADSEEDSEEDSEVDSEESGSQGGEGESSAKKKSEDSEESGDRSEDEESQDNQESEEISEEEPQVESQQGKIITADKESLCSIESSTSEDGVAEEVNHRKRRVSFLVDGTTVCLRDY